MKSEKTIDLDKIIAESNSTVLKKMPRFVIKFLKRLIHQNEINNLVYANNDKYGLDFVESILQYLNIDIRTIGLEHLNIQKPSIFVCNHPLGGIDFFAAITSVSVEYAKLKVIANQILMNLHNLENLFLPVNVFGRSPQHYYEMITKAYESDVSIMTFPSGEVSRKHNGIIRDSYWHKSFVRNAIEYKRNVIPVYIHAKNSKRFYNVGNWREKLGIKLNLELLLLPDELFKQRNNTISVVIGKPIPFSVFDKSLNHYNWAQYVKNRVYDLSKQL